MSSNSRSLKPDRGSILYNARKEKKKTRAQVAEEIGVSERTIFNWETGKSLPRAVQIVALAALLDIPWTLLGFPPTAKFTVEEANHHLRQITDLARGGQFTSAYLMNDQLLTCLFGQVNAGEKYLLEPYACSLYFAGHITAIRSNFFVALRYYEQMEEKAVQLKNYDLQYLALTSQGEMYRRKGELEKALQRMQQVPDAVKISASNRGNLAQLQARVLAGIHREGREASWTSFERALTIARDLDGQASGLYNCFELCGVYVDMARLSAKSSTSRSLEYLEMAEKSNALAKRWQIPLARTKGEILIRKALRARIKDSGDVTDLKDFQEGADALKQAVDLARTGGHVRQEHHIERFCASLPQEALGTGRNYTPAFDYLARYLDLPQASAGGTKDLF